eukprot:COSAG01_NODE_20092_length_971_cov_0.662844_2_plen_51_part_01
MCIDPVSTTPVTRVLTYSANASDCTFTCFFNQKTAYVILRSDWSSDVCSSD